MFLTKFIRPFEKIENQSKPFLIKVVVLNHCEKKGEMDLYPLTVTAIAPPKGMLGFFCPLKTISNNSLLCRKTEKGL